jgi:hypothetical protein
LAVVPVSNPATLSLYVQGATLIPTFVPSSLSIQVPKVSASVNLATYHAVQAPLICAASKGRVIHQPQAALHILHPMISPLALIFQVTSSFCVGRVVIQIPTFHPLGLSNKLLNEAPDWREAMIHASKVPSYPRAILLVGVVAFDT